MDDSFLVSGEMERSSIAFPGLPSRSYLHAFDFHHFFSHDVFFPFEGSQWFICTTFQFFFGGKRPRKGFLSHPSRTLRVPVVLFRAPSPSFFFRFAIEPSLLSLPLTQPRLAMAWIATHLLLSSLAWVWFSIGVGGMDARVSFDRT